MEGSYDLAQTADPHYLPNLEESLGAAYLHMSEMENDVYRGSRDLDIFPPLRPRASYERKEDSQKAIEYFKKYLEQHPDDLEGRWLLNLAYMTLGEYPAGVPSAYLIPEKDFHSKQSVGRFVDVAPAAGLNAFRGAGGVIVDDFDNDGLLDVVVSSLDVCDPIRFLTVDPLTSFIKASRPIGSSGLSISIRCGPRSRISRSSEWEAMFHRFAMNPSTTNPPAIVRRENLECILSLAIDSSPTRQTKASHHQSIPMNGLVSMEWDG